MSDRGSVSSAAARLGVEERDLADLIDQKATYGAVKVLGAVVRLYGLDPSWVVTGTYNMSTHRAALIANAHEVEDLLQQLLAGSVPGPRATETNEGAQ